MQRLNVSVPVVFFLAVLVLLFTGAPVAAESVDSSRLITVTGDAEIKVVPDQIIITMAVETNHTDLDIAKKTNDEKIKKILSVSGEYDIKPEQVQTGQMSIEPRRIFPDKREEFLGYFVRKTVVIQLHDLEKFEGLLSDLLAAGVNYVHNIQLRTSQLNYYMNQARTLAIRAAKEKAALLAEELGQKIGRPHSIKEGHTGWWPGGESQELYGLGSYRTIQGVTNITTDLTSGAQTTTTSIAPGQIIVKAAVTVSFELN